MTIALEANSCLLPRFGRGISKLVALVIVIPIACAAPKTTPTPPRDQPTASTSVQAPLPAPSSKLVLTPPNNGARSQDTVIPLEHLERAIVRVRCAQPTRPSAEGHLAITYDYGTGVVLSTNGWIATAAHVIAPCATTPKAITGVMSANIDGYAPADVVAVDPGADVALLRINPNSLRGIEAMKWDGCVAPPIGSTTYALGIRADAEPRFFELGIIRGVSIERTTRLQDLLSKPKRKEERWIAISQKVLRGYSGGAIIDNRACLVGIIVGAPTLDEQWAEFSYGISILAIAKLMTTDPPAQTRSKELKQ